MNKGSFDQGFDENVDSVFFWGSVGNAGNDIHINTNQISYQRGYPLHFCSPANDLFRFRNDDPYDGTCTPQGNDVRLDYMKFVHPPFRFSRNETGFAAYNQRNGIVYSNDCKNFFDPYGQGSGIIPAVDGSGCQLEGCDDTQQAMIGPAPRAYKISDHFAIGCMHFDKGGYQECGNARGLPDTTMDFYYVDENGITQRHNATVEATRLMYDTRANSSSYDCSRHGGAPYTNPCGLPSGKPDYDHPDIDVVAATRYTDFVLYKFVDPLPSEIPNMVFLDSTFIEKYFFQDCSSYSTPEECSRNTHFNRTFLSLDGLGRPILSTMSFYDYTPVGDSNNVYNVTRRMSDTCVDAGSSEQVASDHIQINRKNTTDVASNSIPSLLDQGKTNYNQNISKLTATDPSDTKDRITKDYSSAFSSTYNLFDGENPFLFFEPDPPSGYSPVLQNIDDHLKTEIAMMNAYPYDVRDFESTAFSGLSTIINDSSSVSLFPIPNADGTEGGRWALFGIQNTNDNIGDFWHRFNMKSAINAIYEEYQNEGAIPSTEYPTYICSSSAQAGNGNEIYDFSEYSISSAATMSGTGQSYKPSTIPTLGYKVFKSTAGQNGPWTDITQQLVTYETADLDSAVTTGVPCLDLSKDASGNFTTPCYTKSTQFVDDQVLQGETYYYYISGLDTSAVTPYYTETQKSQVLKITVPEKSEYSPKGDKVYIDRTSASNGEIVGEQNASQGGGIIHPDEYGTRGEAPYIPKKLLKGYNVDTGGNNLNIPFFGFDTSLGPPISSRPSIDPETGIGNFFYDIVVSDDDPSYNPDPSEMKGGNDGEILGLPLPFKTSSYQYMMGKKYTETNPNVRPNNLLQIYPGNDVSQFSAYNSFLSQVSTLALSRFNRSDQQTLEPYFHSRLYEVFENLRTLIMNPAHYGNYRNFGGQNISWDSVAQIPNDKSTFLPYWSGRFLRNEILGPFGTSTEGYRLQTLIMRDANVANDDMKTIEYMALTDTAIKQTLRYVDISNNGIYRLRVNGSTLYPNEIDMNNLEYLDCSNNNIGSDSDGSRALFLDDISLTPAIQRNMGSGILLNAEEVPDIKYLNMSNNPDATFKIKAWNNSDSEQRTYNNLEYLNVSNTKCLGQETFGFTEDRRPYFPILKYLYMNDARLYDTTTPVVRLGSPINLDTLQMQRSEVEYLSVNDFNVNGSNPNNCFAFDSLREIDISESQIFSLNLQYKDGDGEWENRNFPLVNSPDPIEFGADTHGNMARNVEIIRAKNATALRRIYLPNKEYDPNDAVCPFASEPRYLKVLDLSGTSLGDVNTINEAANIYGSLSYLFLRGYVATLAQVDQYPEGHTLTIDISGIKDQFGAVATLDKYIFCLYDYIWRSKGLNLNIVYDDNQLIDVGVTTCTEIPWFNCSLCGG